ncbi:MAG: transcriptional regulator GcvA [Betaproteobacteria bacterium]|nr:transcriptional regulator GcvA [Betaproteobacteria bacterium]
MPVSRTSNRLPPLNALRAFESAARHLSFALAARELHVTPAAVSHQVKGLEEHLDLKLFRRLARGLELTRAGQALRPKLREGFDRLAEAIEELRALEDAATLAVSVAPSFATRWLAPRLHRFVGAHPDLDVRINASTRLIDPGKGELASGDAVAGSPVEDADIVVRFGTGDYPGFRVDKLMPVSVTPMCSPRLAAGEHALRTAEDLRHHVLIHDNVSSDDGGPLWDAWLKAAGVEGVDTSRGLHFNHAMLALEAAADGMGVALGMPVLAGADLAAGRLVAPLAMLLPLRFAYYVVSAEESGAQGAARGDVAAFRDWLLEEAAREPAQA